MQESNMIIISLFTLHFQNCLPFRVAGDWARGGVRPGQVATSSQGTKSHMAIHTHIHTYSVQTHVIKVCVSVWLFLISCWGSFSYIGCHVRGFSPIIPLIKVKGCCIFLLLLQIIQHFPTQISGLVTIMTKK